MKRSLLFPCALCLVLGLLLGVLLPIDWTGQDSAPPAITAPVGAPAAARGQIAQARPADSASAPPAPPPEHGENFPLLGSACAVVRSLQRQDLDTLSSYVHPSLGVTFTPYSTVDRDSDLTFTQEQIRSLTTDGTVYTWGIEDGRGCAIQMTISQYLDRFVFDKDYTQAPEIGIDRILTTGNALENLAQEYPGCRFVDFTFPSTDPVNDGLDWSSLKLVFQLEQDRWYLVGIVHGEWTT